MQSIIIVGNVVDGLKFCGPFDDAEEAIGYAECYFKNDVWDVCQIGKPIEED